MRVYSWNNFYLSSIQQGIQALHSTAELFTKYKYLSGDTVAQHHMLFDWATNHKTVILLNGGDTDALIDLKGFLNSPDNPYPHAFFEESPGALNGCLTSVSIVLPERMYDAISTKIGQAYLRVKDGGPQVLMDIPLLDLELLRQDVLHDFNERKYTEWELGFLARRVVCSLAK